MSSGLKSETSRMNGPRSRRPQGAPKPRHFTNEGREYPRIRKALRDDLCHLRGGNILNENKILQNEPETPELSPLNATEITPEIFHRTQGTRDQWSRSPRPAKC